MYENKPNDPNYDAEIQERARAYLENENAAQLPRTGKHVKSLLILLTLCALLLFILLAFNQLIFAI